MVCQFFLPSLWVSVCDLVTQSCPTLCNPMNCSPSGSSIHEILQARIMEWIAIPFSRGSSCPRDQTQVSCIVGRLFSFIDVCYCFLHFFSTYFCSEIYYFFLSYFEIFVLPFLVALGISLGC